LVQEKGVKFNYLQKWDKHYSNRYHQYGPPPSMKRWNRIT